MKHFQSNRRKLKATEKALFNKYLMLFIITSGYKKSRDSSFLRTEFPPLQSLNCHMLFKGTKAEPVNCRGGGGHGGSTFLSSGISDVNVTMESGG